MIHYLCAGTGFFLGAKICDALLFDENYYEVLREDIEDEFWQKNGAPTQIQPYLVHSQKAGKEDVIRKSWIYIMFEKDKLVPKKEEID